MSNEDQAAGERQIDDALNGIASVPFSEDALARAFTEQHADAFVYVPAWSRWLRWDGARWQDDNTSSARHAVRLLCRSKAASLVHSDANRVASARTIRAVEQLARADPRHTRRPEQFDTDIWAFNTPGGIVDLRTGKIRQHRPGDYHTKIAGAAPGEACPRWLAFLNEVTCGDAELIAYIQRWAGYTLTGATTEQAFIFIWGPGGNGKTVLQSALQTVLGDYATTAMSDVFTVSMTDQHPTHIARLRGARMVIVSETEEGKGWAESRIKSLTGGDKIAARVMRGDPFEYLPQFKLWFAGNHRPSLRNVDPAMQRRLHLVPLTYVPPKPDPGLLDALKAEAPGILAWAIQGCLTWQRERLGMAAAVQTASQDYFSEQDTVSQWFSERCVRDPDSAEPSSVLFEDWVGFARVRGEEPGSAKRFSNTLHRFLNKKRSGAAMMFLGVRLLQVEEESFSDPPRAKGV